jgi:dolichol-phosphate mannosyltransferase
MSASNYLPKISITIPVYNSANFLRKTFEDLKEKVLVHLPDYEVVFVDDGSQDDSYLVMKEIQKLEKNVKIFKLARNFGANANAYACLSLSTGDCAVLFPDDGQVPAEMVLKLYESWLNGNRVVWLTRAKRADPKLTSTLYYWFVKKFVNKNMPIAGMDVGLVDRQVIDVLKRLDEKDSAILLQILWMGFRTDIVSFDRKPRISGKSGYDFFKRLNLAVDSIIGFSKFPLRLLSFVGFIFLVIAVVWSIILASYRIFVGVTIEGWTTLTIVMLLTTSLLLLSLSLIGEYIWRILDAARSRPVFIVDEEKSDEDTDEKAAE